MLGKLHYLSVGGLYTGGSQIAQPVKGGGRNILDLPKRGAKSLRLVKKRGAKIVSFWCFEAIHFRTRHVVKGGGM